MPMSHFEQFSADDLEQLRADLRHSGLDSFQAGLLISNFLALKGYGVNAESAREAAARFELPTCTLPHMQAELEQMARVM